MSVGAGKMIGEMSLTLASISQIIKRPSTNPQVVRRSRLLVFCCVLVNFVMLAANLFGPLFQAGSISAI